MNGDDSLGEALLGELQIVGTMAPPWHASALEVVSSLFDRRPPWADQSWVPTGSVGWQPTPRSKTRTKLVARATAARLKAAVQRSHPEQLTGVSAGFGSDEWTHPTGFGPFDIGVDGNDSRISAVCTFLVPEQLRHDSALGPELLHWATRIVESLDVLSWGAMWFGNTPTPPYAYAPDYPDSPALLRGYDLLVCIPAEALHRLGGASRLRSAPVVDSSLVTTQSGDECAVALLANSLAEVDTQALRRWKDFLMPALDAGAPARRAESFSAFAIPNGDRAWQRPLYILDEDWPSPPAGNDLPSQ